MYIITLLLLNIYFKLWYLIFILYMKQEYMFMIHHL